MKHKGVILIAPSYFTLFGSEIIFTLSYIIPGHLHSYSLFYFDSAWNMFQLHTNENNDEQFSYYYQVIFTLNMYLHIYTNTVMYIYLLKFSSNITYGYIYMWGAKYIVRHVPIITRGECMNVHGT